MRHITQGVKIQPIPLTVLISHFVRKVIFLR